MHNKNAKIKLAASASKRKNSRAARLFLSQYVWRYKIRIALAAVGLVIFSLTAFAQVRLLEPLLDKGFAAGSTTSLYALMALMFAFSVLRAIAYYLQISQSGYVGSAIFCDLQKVLYKHLIHNDLAFMQREATGKYVSLMMANMHLIRNSLSRLFVSFLRDGVLVIAYLFNMFYTDWSLSLITFLFITLIFIPVRWLSQRTRLVALQTQKKIGDTGKFLDESFKGIRHIKAYNAESEYIKNAFIYFEKLFFWNKRTSYAQATAMPIVEIIAGLSFACVVLIGGWQIHDGSLTIGGVMSFVIALLLLLQPVRTLVNLNIDLQESIAAIGNLYHTLEQKPTVRDKPHAKKLIVTHGDIEFRNVYFAYHDDSKQVKSNASTSTNYSQIAKTTRPPALNNLSFKVKGGTKVAIVGASGAGKSTIVNLLLRFYSSNKGQIFIDKQNIEQRTSKSLRDQISYVSQDIGLFNDSLRNNIALGVKAIDEKRLQRAIEDAEAENFIAQMPDGVNTEIGEKGFRLSGGQQQRIALARAIYKNAPIVILDEATAALDNETERLLQKTLDRVMRKRTVITIAHRLTTIKNADNIYVIEDGYCNESGSHNALLRNRGIYAQLWDRISREQKDA